jgi:hypothetical protein
MLRMRAPQPPPGAASVAALAEGRLLGGFWTSGLLGVTGACLIAQFDKASAVQHDAIVEAG